MTKTCTWYAGFKCGHFFFFSFLFLLLCGLLLLRHMLRRAYTRVKYNSTRSCSVGTSCCVFWGVPFKLWRRFRDIFVSVRCVHVYSHRLFLQVRCGRCGLFIACLSYDALLLLVWFSQRTLYFAGPCFDLFLCVHCTRTYRCPHSPRSSCTASRHAGE